MAKAKRTTKPATAPVATKTANGVVKGRPGKGRVYTLGQRKVCYAGHPMTPANTFVYCPKLADGKRGAERVWCRKCRALSRKRSAASRAGRMAEAVAGERKDGAAAIDAAFEPPKGAKAAVVRSPSSRLGKAAAARKAKAAAKETTGKVSAAQQRRADRVAEQLGKVLADDPPEEAPTKRVVTKSGGIECGECGGMFSDPPTASKHIAKCKGKSVPAPKATAKIKAAPKARRGKKAA